jgi:hypothetical protein
VYPQEEEAQLFEALRASEREAERMKAMKSEVRAAREAAIRAAQAAEAAELRARHLEDRWKFEARSTPTKDWRPGRDVEVDFGVAMNARAGAWDEEDEDAFTLAEALRAERGGIRTRPQVQSSSRGRTTSAGMVRQGIKRVTADDDDGRIIQP